MKILTARRARSLAASRFSGGFVGRLVRTSWDTDSLEERPDDGSERSKALDGEDRGLLFFVILSI